MKRRGSLRLSTRHPVKSAASKRLAVSTGAERSGRPIVEIRAHVMAHTGRRSYFAAPQRRAGTHVLLPPCLRGGEPPRLRARIAKRWRGNAANRRRREGGGRRGERRRTRTEGRRVDRIENHFETQGLRRIRVSLSRPYRGLDATGFPRGTLAPPTSYLRDRKRRHAIAEISSSR